MKARYDIQIAKEEREGHPNAVSANLTIAAHNFGAMLLDKFGWENDYKPDNPVTTYSIRLQVFREEKFEKFLKEVVANVDTNTFLRISKLLE